MAETRADCVIQVCGACQLPAHEGTDRSPTDGERVLALCRDLVEKAGLGDRVAVRSYTCMGGCKRRCRVNFAAGDKWTWLVGDIDPQKDGPFLLDTLLTWIEAEQGFIPKPDRSKALLAKGLGRVPPLDL